MLDNKDNQFEMDDQFYDQAWTSMQDMLDQEMPVLTTAPSKRRKKPYALLLLLWLVGFGAGISSILLWQQKMEPTSPEKMLPTIPIANVEQAIKETGLIERGEAEKQFAENQIIKESKLALVKPLIKESKISAQKAVVSNFTKSNIVSIINNASDKNSTLPNTSSIDKPNLTELQSKAIFNNPLHLESKQIASLEKFNLLPLIIESVDFAGIVKIENDKVLSELLIPADKKIKFNWGLMAGAHSETGSGYGGYSLGFIVNAEMDRRFGFATGLMFNRFQFNNIILNNSPGAFNLNQSNDLNPGVYNDVTEVPFQTRSSNSSSSAVRLGSANYVSVPLMLTYKTSRTFRVNMGVEYARMLNASSDKFNGNGNQDFSSSYKWYDTSAYGDLLNKTNFTALFGLSLQPNEQFGFDLRYNHGFTDLSKNKGQFAGQSDTRESLQFSIMYYFGKRM